MKKRIFAVVLPLLIAALVSACGAAPTAQNANDNPAAPTNQLTEPSQTDADGNGQGVQTDGMDDPAQPLSGKLTIAQCYDFLYLDDAVTKFEALHPDVDIELTKFENDTEKYATQLSADLMAGTAPDLFETAWNIETTKLADTGMIADIKPFMDNDPDYTDENYFMNVFEGMTYNGGIYEFPANFSYSMVGINSTLPEDVLSGFRALPSISGRALMDMTMAVRENSDLYLDSNFDASILVQNVIKDFIDIENKTCSFDSPAFIELVNDAKALTEPSKEFGMSMSSNLISVEEDNRESQKYAFKDISGDNYQYFLGYDEYLFRDFIPKTDSKGQLLLIPQKGLSMNANAENKQLAWEFIKFLSSMEANTNIFVPGLPVKKEVYDQVLTEDISGYYDNMTDTGLTPAGDPEAAKAAAKEKLDSFAVMPMRTQTSPFSQIIQENLQLFQDGTITAEQLAADLQNKISIALME